MTLLSQVMEPWRAQFKWIVATIAVACWPSLLWAVVRALERALEAPWYFSVFLTGMALSIVLLKSRFISTDLRRRIANVERDAFEFVIAFVTLQVQRDTSAPPNQSHRRLHWTRQHGWLTNSCSLLFPLLPLLLYAISWCVPLGTIRSLFLGFGTGYHVLTRSQLLIRDPHQLDAFGRSFVAMFFPPALVFVWLMLVSFATNGFSGWVELFSDLLMPVQWVMKALISNQPSTSE